jgi:hypothetical protein
VWRSPGMASAVAAYLSTADRGPSAAGSPAQPQRPPGSINPGIANAREKPATDVAHNTRHDQTAKSKLQLRLLREGSDSERMEVPKPSNGVETQTPPSASPRLPVLEDFEQ